MAKTNPAPAAPETAAIAAPETTAMPAARRKVLPSDPDPVAAPAVNTAPVEGALKKED